MTTMKGSKRSKPFNVVGLIGQRLTNQVVGATSEPNRIAQESESHVDVMCQ